MQLKIIDLIIFCSFYPLILLKQKTATNCGFLLVDGGGFEPPKAELADLQSAPFGHSGTRP